MNDEKIELTEDQQNNIQELKRWFSNELKALKKRELAIMRDYEAKKEAILHANVKKSISSTTSKK